MSNAETLRALEAEIAQLRQRLAEAEDLRRAIGSAEIDALVVGPDGASRVLLLSDAYQRYRRIVDRMHQGAVTVLASSGDILFANRHFADSIAESMHALFSEPLHSYVEHAYREPLLHYLRTARVGSEIEVTLMRRDGSAAPVRFTLAVHMDGYASLIVSDQPRQEASHAEEAVQALRDGHIDAVVVRNEAVVLIERPIIVRGERGPQPPADSGGRNR